MDKREYVIFGAGRIGEKVLYRIWQSTEISCFWDNNKMGEVLGYRIEKPSYKTNVFIIVALQQYFEVRSQLISMGYQEFIDFIPYQVYERKMAVAYGNCHMDAVKHYLESNKMFSKEYGFYPFPMIQDISLTSDFDYMNVLSHADLFLHQSVRENNMYSKEQSSKYMLTAVPTSCKVLALPNLYGMPKCFFPQLITKFKRLDAVFYYYFFDSNIVEWLKEGKHPKEIANKISNGGIYSKEYILEMWETFREKLLFREYEWDIKISDYIFENYKTEKLFCDTNHITAKTAREIAKRVLKFLKYDCIDINAPLIGMDWMEAFIYPDVKDALGLTFEEKIIRRSCVDVFGDCDYEEYIERICTYTLLNMKYL